MNNPNTFQEIYDQPGKVTFKSVNWTIVDDVYHQIGYNTLKQNQTDFHNFERIAEQYSYVNLSDLLRNRTAKAIIMMHELNLFQDFLAHRMVIAHETNDKFRYIFERSIVGF